MLYLQAIKSTKIWVFSINKAQVYALTNFQYTMLLAAIFFLMLNKDLVLGFQLFMQLNDICI